MYKVEKYKYKSESTSRFTYGEIYYLRSSKDGTKKFLSTNDDGCELKVSNPKISLSNYYNNSFLKENFNYKGFILYKNFNEFKRGK